jgi:hypothetical protein
MADDDVTLQELIVRALTGQDEDARRSIETATADDAELRQFFSDLQGIVGLLADSRDWRALPGGPSPELSAKIRAAVVAKLPAAPPHFRTVVLEADLGRRRATRKLFLTLAGGALLIAAAIYFWQRNAGDAARLKLSGKAAFEAALKDDKLEAWELSSGQWLCDKEGLRAAGDDDAPAAIVLKKAFDAAAALALNLDVRVPSLDDASSATIHINDDAARLRGFDGLSLQITSDGLILNGPNNALLQSQHTAGAGERFHRVRIEYLGRYARLIVNGEVLFDGLLARPLEGPLRPAIRVAGPQKNKIVFNALRIEQ